MKKLEDNKMRWATVFLIFFVFIGCKSSNIKKIEFISASARALDYKDTDSLILGVYIHFYAQISTNGNCSVVRSINQKGNVYSYFKINKALFRSIKIKLSQIDSDTSLTESCEGCMYDGPTLELIKQTNDGKTIRVFFADMEKTDSEFLKLYSFIDSTSQNTNHDHILDTLSLLNARDLKINLIKEEALKSGNTFGRDTIAIIK
jgi:hypothetical protein